jgi:glycosyltransferase involved in cell wall biosynthesis
MSLRIAHFVQRYPPALGGSEAYFARLSRWLVGQGDRVSVFTTNADALEAFWLPTGRCLPAGVSLDDGVEVRRYRLVGRCRGRRWLLKPLSLLPWRTWQCLTLSCNPWSWEMWRDVHRVERRFDVVHATAFPYAFPIWCALRLARRLGVPFCLTPFLHLGDPTQPRDPTRKVYTSAALLSLAQAADVVFVQTPGERTALLSCGIAPNRIVLQGLGVDAAECTGGARWSTRADWAAGPHEVVVGHLANNSEEKGSVDLLRAAEKLWSQGVQFQLVLAGPEMPNFRRFWQTYRFADRVRRLGVVSATGKRDFFAGIDVFALPSRSDSFGLVLLEAWANGLPNLAYRAGGVADLVQHDRDGLLVPCGDVDALAAALRLLVEQTELRQRLGAASQSRALREFRWEDKLQCVRDVLTMRCRTVPATSADSRGSGSTWCHRAAAPHNHRETTVAVPGCARC